MCVCVCVCVCCVGFASPELLPLSCSQLGRQCHETVHCTGSDSLSILPHKLGTCLWHHHPTAGSQGECTHTHYSVHVHACTCMLLVRHSILIHIIIVYVHGIHNWRAKRAYLVVRMARFFCLYIYILYICLVGRPLTSAHA